MLEDVRYRLVVPCIVRGARRCRYATGAGLLGNRFGDLRRGFRRTGRTLASLGLGELERASLTTVLAEGLR